MCAFGLPCWVWISLSMWLLWATIVPLLLVTRKFSLYSFQEVGCFSLTFTLNTELFEGLSFMSRSAVRLPTWDRPGLGHLAIHHLWVCENQSSSLLSLLNAFRAPLPSVGPTFTASASDFPYFLVSSSAPASLSLWCGQTSSCPLTRDRIRIFVPFISLK